MSQGAARCAANRSRAEAFMLGCTHPHTPSRKSTGVDLQEPLPQPPSPSPSPCRALECARRSRANTPSRRTDASSVLTASVRGCGGGGGGGGHAAAAIVGVGLDGLTADHSISTPRRMECYSETHDRLAAKFAALERDWHHLGSPSTTRRDSLGRHQVVAARRTGSAQPRRAPSSGHHTRGPITLTVSSTSRLAECRADAEPQRAPPSPFHNFHTQLRVQAERAGLASPATAARTVCRGYTPIRTMRADSPHDGKGREGAPTSSALTVLRCGKCGTRIGLGAGRRPKFCGECGTKLEVAA